MYIYNAELDIALGWVLPENTINLIYLKQKLKEKK